MIRIDTKRLPLLKGQVATSRREYLFAAIDDFSRELYVAILPDKTADSAAKSLQEEVINSDNGTEYKGTPHHAFALACFQNGISQNSPALPDHKPMDKAERFIRTLMEMWHDKIIFTNGEHRKKNCVDLSTITIRSSLMAA